MLVHDIKNPLQNIINISEKNQTQNEVELIKFSAFKILNLILNILDTNKINKTNLKLKLSDCELNKIIENSYKQLKFLAHTKNITIETPENNYLVEGDEYILERVFTNILSNSLKYTSNNGKIMILTEIENDNLVKVTISDNGIGIESAEINNIFSDYHQTENTISYSTGLGLSFCKIAIEAHGKKIKILSEKNSGTQITFWLNYKNKINNNLQINNTLINKEITAHIFYRSSTAEEGIEIAKEMKPDIILTDWAMPKLSGIDLIKILKSCNITKNIPVIMISHRIRKKMNLPSDQNLFNFLANV